MYKGGARSQKTLHNHKKEKRKRGEFSELSDLHPAFPLAKYGNKNPQRVSPSSLGCTMKWSHKMVLQGCKRRT